MILRIGLSSDSNIEVYLPNTKNFQSKITENVKGQFL